MDLREHQFLDPAEIVLTIERLSRRIEERFEGAGLAKVSQRLLQIATQARERSQWIARPNVPLRVLTYGLIASIVIASVVTIRELPIPQRISLLEFVAIFESSINDVVLIGAAAIFLVTLETRIKRQRALSSLHELRSIAHVIDMHQLTKDPARPSFVGTSTPSSPKRTLSPFELERYLNYCSELLSLTGKVAAVYVQDFEDSDAVSAANDVESLCSSLSRKIWQKIDVLENFVRPETA